MTAYNKRAGRNPLYTRVTERKFKRHVLSPAARKKAATCGLFLGDESATEIFVYSDESGVFDKNHEPYYVFGGIAFLSSESMQIASRKYIAAEKAVRQSLGLPEGYEIKASAIPNKYKGKLFRSMNHQFRFGAIISQKQVLNSIFADKKDKQRYLDYVYKIMIKRYFKSLINGGVLNKSEACHFHFFVDEHSTATNGRYELKESIERELMYGTYNQTWDHRYEPIFDVVGKVDLKFSNSADVTLVRAADIIANRIHFKAYRDRCFQSVRNDFFVIRQP